jgi:citrate lyase subunit beta/citryl-CoA lyase
VSTPETLEQIGAQLDGLWAQPTLQVWAMIETPLAILHAEAIARAARDPRSRLSCFVLGTNDLAKETRARFVPGRAPMLPWLTSAILAARAHGLDILDGVYNDLKNEDGFKAECEQGRDIGFDGKTLIHPAQVAMANAVFAPDETELTQAKAIIAAFALPENQGKGAIQLGGRMVELLHAEMAKRAVALSEAIGG